MMHKYIKFPRSALVKTWGLKALCKAYSWPSGLAGGGTIAIVELAGGWLASDVAAFCRGEGIPEPTITDVSVDGTMNDPGKSDADGEVALDIQVATAAYSFATGKPANIRMYWAQDIATAVRAATKDGCDVCSISWGSDEADWQLQPGSAQDMEAAVLEAVTAGMVVFAASGDNDSSDGGKTPANVDLPAGCPSVIGCGGTRLLDDGTRRGPETVWQDNPGQADGEGTGGGFSTLFPMPSWQAGAPHGPGRMVPDVAADADPVTGLHILIDGQWQVVGGTSGVAPLYAGLFAAFGKKLGFITPKLYLNHLAFNDIVSGENGKYRAGPGPDPCTGLGSPIGTALAKLFVKP
jgi:subtilase family serine protease